MLMLSLMNFISIIYIHCLHTNNCNVMNRKKKQQLAGRFWTEYTERGVDCLIEYWIPKCCLSSSQLLNESYDSCSGSRYNQVVGV